MAHELYENYKPRAESMQIISRADSIIKQYQAEGLNLTLRQAYYQFVARGWIENSDKSYDRLGKIISRARLGGYLDWDAIEDRNRVPVVWKHYATVLDVIKQAIRTFRLPRLDGQETYVELWVEKDALSGVLRPIASDYHVTLMANKGYSSSTAMKEAGDRLRACCNRYGSTNCVILYLGDLDPSGEDMVRDIDNRISDFLNAGLEVDWSDPKTVSVEKHDDMRERKPWIDVEVRKLALTIEQVREYKPPPNPAKVEDSRYKTFVKKYGKSSWEVDALPPTVLRDLIREELEELLDIKMMDSIIKKEKGEVARLNEALKQMKDKGPSPAVLRAALEGIINEFNDFAEFDDETRWTVEAAIDNFGDN